MHSCMETTSFGAICDFFFFQAELLPRDKNLVVYLLLLSNTSRGIVPGIASLFFSFYSFLAEKNVSLNFIRTNTLRTLSGENNDYVLLSTI